MDSGPLFATVNRFANGYEESSVKDGVIETLGRKAKKVPSRVAIAAMIAQARLAHFFGVDCSSCNWVNCILRFRLRALRCCRGVIIHESKKKSPGTTHRSAEGVAETGFIEVVSRDAKVEVHDPRDERVVAIGSRRPISVMLVGIENRIYAGGSRGTRILPKHNRLQLNDVRYAPVTMACKTNISDCSSVWRCAQFGVDSCQKICEQRSVGISAG